MTNLDSVLKSRDNTLPTKVHTVKNWFFLIVMYRCESWTIKKAKLGRSDAFELWCWKRLLRFLWTARTSNQSILKEINLNIHWKDCCWSFNTLATWLEEPAHWQRPWCWERLKAKRRRWRKRMRWLDSITDSTGHAFEQTIGDNEAQGSLACCSSWSRKESDMTYRLNNNRLSRNVLCLFWDRTRRSLWPSAHVRSLLPLLSLLACRFRDAAAVLRGEDSGASGLWTRLLRSRTVRCSPAELRQATGGRVKEETALSPDSVWLWLRFYAPGEDQHVPALVTRWSLFFSFPRCGVVWDLGRPRRNWLSGSQ